VKIASEEQVAIALHYAKQKNYESMKDYYNQFLRPCVVIPQQPNDIYLCEAFREGLWTKIQMAIINMPQRELVEIRICDNYGRRITNKMQKYSKISSS